MTHHGPAGATGSRAFALLLGGQLASLVGSGLSRFALGVWVFEVTGSASQFTLIAFFAGLPALLASPFAGALVDRWDRRLVLLASDGLAAASALVLALLHFGGALAPWHIFVAVAVSSLGDAFQWPASVAATTLLVPKRHLGRAAGLTQLAQATATVLAPVPAALLLGSVGLSGVLAIDVSTFFVAGTILLFVRIPSPPETPGADAGRSSLGRRVAEGWAFLRGRPGLLRLLEFFAAVNLVFSVAVVLIVPLVLTTGTRETAAAVLATANAGVILGSLLMSATGGPRRRIHGVLGFGIAAGVAMAGVGLRPEPAAIAAALFLMMFGAPLINGSSQAIWQAKTPPGMQGRVFALRRMIAQATAPVGTLVAGPLAEHVFEPAMAEGGALAGTAGRLLGVGPGRGIGLLYVLIAVVPVVAGLVAYSRPRLRRLEEEIPDAVE